ncbi:MAG: hypothetical protein ACTHMH_00740 [Curtobacterium sp.]
MSTDPRSPRDGTTRPPLRIGTVTAMTIAGLASLAVIVAAAAYGGGFGLVVIAYFTVPLYAAFIAAHWAILGWRRRTRRTAEWVGLVALGTAVGSAFMPVFIGWEGGFLAYLSAFRVTGIWFAVSTVGFLATHAVLLRVRRRDRTATVEN